VEQMKKASVSSLADTSPILIALAGVAVETPSDGGTTCLAAGGTKD